MTTRNDHAIYDGNWHDAWVLVETPSGDLLGYVFGSEGHMKEWMAQPHVDARYKVEKRTVRFARCPCGGCRFEEKDPKDNIIQCIDHPRNHPRKPLRKGEMPKSHTKMKAGRLVAVYVEDAQGRRLVLAQEGKHGHTLEDTLILAHTQAEAKQAIAALRQLAEELPP